MIARHTALVGPALLLPLLLAACDAPGGSSGPGAVSEGEARALDEAAEMLEERRLPPEALSNPAVEGDGNGAETPAPAAPAQQ